MDIKALDGKKMTMHPDPASGLQKCMFGCLTCCTFHVTGVNKIISDDEVHGVNFKICDIFPMSPCPCCLCCGVGPRAAVFKFKKDPADSTKWVGFDSVFASGCCKAATHHDGDYFFYNAEHDGTPGKPVEMHAGNNPMAPPCFIGKKVGEFRLSNKGGAPPSADVMER